MTMRSCVGFVWAVLFVLTVRPARAQMLPPAESVFFDNGVNAPRVIPAADAREVVAAFRRGDFRTVALKLVGRDLLLGAPSERPPSQARSSTGRQFRAFDVTPADELGTHDQALIQALGAFCDSDYGRAYGLARLLDQSATDTAGSLDAARLTALVLLQRRALPLAWRSAQPLEHSPAAADRALFQLVASTTGSYEGPGRGSVPVWRSYRDDAAQPLALVWEVNGFFMGLLAVERQPQESRPERKFQVVFRDLDGPPLVIAACGPLMPTAESLITATSFPQYSLDTFPLYNINYGFTGLREQMEALFAVEADLAPLAVAWCRPDSASNTILLDQVESPLRARRAWDWELRGRWGAGELNGLRVREAAFIIGDTPVVNFVFEYGQSGPPTWEILGYINRDVPRGTLLRDFPQTVEHLHFSVGTGDDRRHVASYRLVSEPVRGGERLYLIQSLVNRQMAVLEVLAGPISFDTFRDKVLAWVNAWPEPGTRALASKPVVTLDFDDLDASDRAVKGTPLRKYLATQGITLESLTPESEVVVTDTRRLYEGTAARAASPPNVLTHNGRPQAISFVMRFDRPLDRVAFARAALIPHPSSGITHPGWKATAVADDGRELDVAGEELIASYVDVPPARFTLHGPGIVAVRWESDAKNFAAFSGVLIDDLVLYSATGTEPTTSAAARATESKGGLKP